MHEHVPCSSMNGMPPCDKEATSRYTWAWGETGACCPNHQIMVNQRAKSLRREVYFSPLNVPEPSLERPERIQLRATIATLDAEIGDAKKAGLEHYQRAQKLGDEVRRYRARAEDLEAQLRDATAALERVKGERDAAVADLATTRAEIEAMKPLLETDDWNDEGERVEGEPTTRP